MKTTKEMQQEIQSKFPFIELREEYKGANQKITLRCNNCGNEWKAVPRSVVISKYGCPKCGVQKARFEKAKKLLEYINFVTPVTIICPIHREFQQTPAKHLSGHNCPKCMGKKLDY